MINQKGIIQNNKAASDFIRQQRKYNEVYKILDKDEERRMIEQYAKLKFVDGKLVYRTKPSEPGKKDDFQCEFDWIGSEDELRFKLVMHNLQAVTNISAKYCQDTRDFDNMYAKGLFGLVRAANEFHPFKLITVKTDHGKDVKLDKNGNYGFVKFNTFAQNWIFKYVVDEFYAKDIKIDNNSKSINEIVRMNGGDNRSMTLENYIQSQIAPEIETQKGVVDEISASELSSISESLHKYIETTNDISAIGKSILEESFYNGNDNLKRLSTILKIPQKLIMEEQMAALSTLKDFLYEEYGIENLSDLY